MSVDHSPAELPRGLLEEYRESARLQLQALADLADRLAAAGDPQDPRVGRVLRLLAGLTARGRYGGDGQGLGGAAQRRGRGSRVDDPVVRGSARRGARARAAGPAGSFARGTLRRGRTSCAPLPCSLALPFARPV